MKKITFKFTLPGILAMVTTCLFAAPDGHSFPFGHSEKNLWNTTYNVYGNHPVDKKPTISFGKNPIISSGGTTFFCSGGSLTLVSSSASAYQWFKDGDAIDSATSQSFIVTENGDYAVMIYGEGPSQLSESVTVKQADIWTGAAADNRWDNPLNWNCGVIPSTTDHVVIVETTDTFPVISDASTMTVFSLALAQYAALSVEAGSTLAVTDAISVDATASLVLEDEASLLQVNDVVNSGIITAKRVTTPMTRYDFTYWSSPVDGQTLYNLSPNTQPDKYYSFSPTIGNWISYQNGAAPMEKGIGYIVRAPQDFSTTLASPYTDGAFTGVPNNGLVEVPIIIGSSDMNLIGNPYPSAIDADLFLSNAGNAALTDGTIYLWTHNSAPELIPGDNTYNYTSNDYAAYNLLGGTATTTVGNNETPTGKIASGQSFFIKGLSAGTAVFDNSMRIASENNQFFRTQNSTESLEKNRIWLHISNDQGAFKQMLLGYPEGATDGVDRNYDGLAFNGNTFLNFYSISNGQHFAIQGRALPFDQDSIVPLGYSTTLGGTFSIKLDDFDGFFGTQEIYLFDHLTQGLHNLKDEPYQFTTATGTYNERFEIRFTNTVLHTEVFSDENVGIACKDANLQIKATSAIDTVTIYDITGRAVYEKSNIGLREFNISDLDLNLPTVLLVRIKLSNNTTFTRKAVLN